MIAQATSPAPLRAARKGLKPSSSDFLDRHDAVILSTSIVPGKEYHRIQVIPMRSES